MSEYDRAVAALGPGHYAYARCTLVDLAGRLPDRVWYMARAREEDPWLPRYEHVLGDELYEREGHYDHRGIFIPLPRYQLDFERLRPPDAAPVQQELFG